MNPLPPNADELVSAYLDGQATPDEVVIVESSPELMERVDTMRSLAGLLAEPVAPPPALKEAHISAALDSFDALFSADAADTTASATPPLTVVPTSAKHEPVASTPKLATPEGVTSLATARERRRPRRFNTGIIAAAAAAVLLFVALASFGFGGGQDSLDVALSGVEAADTGDSASADEAEEPMIEAAIDNQEAMDDDSRGAQLSDAGPAPTAAPPQAMAAQPADEAAADAMDDAAMDEAEDAVEEEADGDSDAADHSEELAEDLAAEPLRLFEGDFPDQDTLRFELRQLPLDELAERADSFVPGLFPDCQQDVPELADSETATLVGDAFVAGELVEIHQLIDGDAITIVLVDPTDCSVLPKTP